MVYQTQNPRAASNRFFLSYAGGSPSAANCASLASAIEALWLDDLAPLIWNSDILVEVDVLDIASDSGNSGQWVGSEAATRSGTQLPIQAATNVEFEIQRRYRGGKPRMFLPPGVQADVTDGWEWDDAFIDEVNTNVTSFFTGISELDIGSMGALAHVNLSYYQGFKNLANSSGRERAVPQYRDTAVVDTVTGYACKAVLGSQRRRRTSTTP